MIRGAVNEAAKRVDEEAQSKMGGMLSGLGLPPGMV
jgi:DNA-binding protein YbaB